MKNMTKAFILMLVLTLVLGVGVAAKAEAADTLKLQEGFGADFVLSLLQADENEWPEDHVFSKTDLLLFKLEFNAQATSGLYYGEVSTDENGNLVPGESSIEIPHTIAAAYYSNLSEAEGKVLYTYVDGVVTIQNDVAKADTSTIFEIPYTSNADLKLNGVPTTEDDPNSLAKDQQGNGIFTWWYDQSAKKIKLKFTKYAFTNDVLSMYLNVGGTVDFDALDNDNQFTFEVANQKETLDLAIGYGLTKSAVMVLNTETDKYEVNYTLKMTLDRDHCLPSEKDGTLSIKDVAGSYIGEPVDVSISHASATGVEIAYDANSKSFNITSSADYVPKGEYTITYTSPLNVANNVIEEDGGNKFNWNTDSEHKKNTAEIIKNEEPTNVKAEAEVYYSPMRDYVKVEKGQKNTSGSYNNIYAETDDNGDTSYYVDYYVDVKIKQVDSITKIKVVDPATDYLVHATDAPTVQYVEGGWDWYNPDTLGTANATVTRNAATGDFVLEANEGEKLKTGVYRLNFRMKLTDKAIEAAAGSETPLALTNRITQLYVEDVPVPNPYQDLEETITIPTGSVNKAAQLVTTQNGKTLIKWVVTFNRGFYVGNDAEVFDTLTNGKVIASEKYPFTITNNGVEIIGEKNITNGNGAGLTFQEGYTKFSYMLGANADKGEQTDKEYVITYYTEVQTNSDGSYVTTTNKVAVDYTGDDEPDNEVTVGYPTDDPEKPDVKKSGERTVDSATNTMTVTWKVEVDLERIPFDLLEKLVITDTLPEGMTLVAGQTVVKLHTGSQEYTLYNKADDAFRGTYSQTEGTNGDSVAVELDIAALRYWKSVFPDCKKVTLTFVAKGPVNESGKTTYENTAVVDYAYGPYEDPDPVTATGEVEYNSAVVVKEKGNNLGEDNYSIDLKEYGKTDGKLDFIYQVKIVDATIKDRDTTTEIVFRDTLPSVTHEGNVLPVLTYADGSLYYSNAGIWDQWGTDYDIILTPAISGNVMSATFDLPANWPSETVYIYYVCNVSDAFVDAINTTKNTIEFKEGGDYSQLTNTVTVKIDDAEISSSYSTNATIIDNALSKTASLINPTGNSAAGVSYTIEINKDARKLNNGDPLLLEDAMSFGNNGEATVLYDQSSFVLKSGETVLDASQYTLQFNIDGTSFQLTVPDSTALTLTYTAKPVVASGTNTGDFSNRAKLAGRTRVHEQSGFMASASGQGAQTKDSRTLQINKREKTAGSSEFLGNPIKGAQFSIYSVDDQKKETRVATITTDENGQATWTFTDDRIFDKVYVMHETKTPEGYEALSADENEWYFYFLERKPTGEIGEPKPEQQAIINALTAAGKTVDVWKALTTYTYTIGNAKLPANPTTVTLDLTKALNSEIESEFEEQRFTFELIADSSNPDGYEILNTADDDGKYLTEVTFTSRGTKETKEGDFAPFQIKFTAEGTYTFTVQETTESNGYLLCDDTVYTVTYVVSQPDANADTNELQVQWTIKAGENTAQAVSFTNKYGYVNFSGWKAWGENSDNDIRLQIDKDTFKEDYLQLWKKVGDADPVQVKDTSEYLTVYSNDSGQPYGQFNWYYTKLPAWENEEEIIYIIKEATVNGYQTFYANEGHSSYDPYADDALYPKPNYTDLELTNILAASDLEITKSVNNPDYDADEGNTVSGTFNFLITPDEKTLKEAGNYHFFKTGTDGKLVEILPVDGKFTVSINVADVTSSKSVTLPLNVYFDNFNGEPKTFTFTVEEDTTGIPDGWAHEKKSVSVTYEVVRTEYVYNENGFVKDRPVVSVTRTVEQGKDTTFTNTYHMPTSISVTKKWMGGVPTLTDAEKAALFTLQYRVKDSNAEWTTDTTHSLTITGTGDEWSVGNTALPAAIDGKVVEWSIVENVLDGYKTEYLTADPNSTSSYALDGETICNIRKEASINAYFKKLISVNSDGFESFDGNKEVGGEFTFKLIPNNDNLSEGVTNLANDFTSYTVTGGNDDLVVEPLMDGDTQIGWKFTVELEYKPKLDDLYGYYTVGEILNSIGFTFREEGHYYFTLKEDISAQPKEYWQYDNAECSLMYSVNEKFAIEEGIWPGASNEDGAIEFLNTYEEMAITIYKVWRPSGDWSGAPMSQDALLQSLYLKRVVMVNGQEQTINYGINEEGEWKSLYDLNRDGSPISVSVENFDTPEWTITITGLPVYIDGEVADDYAVVETKPDGYKVEYLDVDEAAKGENNAWALSGETIVNTCMTTSVTVYKWWNHNGSKAADANIDITDWLTLYAITKNEKGEEVSTEIGKPTKRVKAPVEDGDQDLGVYLYIWEDLPKYVDDDDPEKGEIRYEVVETPEDGYYISSDFPRGLVGFDREISNDYFKHFVVFNLQKYLDNEDAKTAFTFELQRVDENGDAIGAPITTTNITELDPSLGREPGWAAIRVDYAGEDLATKTFYYTLKEQEKDGYVCDPTVYKIKVEIKYETKEIVDNWFTGSVSVTPYWWDESANEGKGDYVPLNKSLEFNNYSTVDVTVNKVWKGLVDEETAPAITLKLWKREIVGQDEQGNPVEQETELTGLNPVKTNNSYTWEDMQAYNQYGPIVYFVKEEPIDGFMTEYDPLKIGEDADQDVPKDFALNGENITNTYEATGELNLSASKTVNGKTPTDKEVFSFTITGYGGVNETVQNKGGTITFSPLKYDQDDVGENITYTVTETGTAPAGYTLSTKVYNVKVTLTDDGKGNLSASYTVTDEADKVVEAMVFENTYEAVGSVTFAGTKSIEGRAMTAADVFEFTITEGSKTVATVKNTGSTIKYPTISYTLADVGPHTYTVKETSANGNGIKVDTKTHTVKVEVSDNGDGTLSVTKLAGSYDYTALNFENTYEATGELNLSASKTVNGKTPTDKEVFSFTITGYGGVNETVQNKGGTITFSPLKYDQDDVGENITYTVTETGTAPAGYTLSTKVYNVKVTLTDDGKGNLSASYTVTDEADKVVEAMVFENTYIAPTTPAPATTAPATTAPATTAPATPAPATTAPATTAPTPVPAVDITLTGSKVLTGREFQAGDKFYFELVEEGSVIQRIRVMPVNGHEAEFTFTIPDKTAGKYTYTVRESAENPIRGITYDTAKYAVEVTVTADADGKLTAEAAFELNDQPAENIVFSNAYHAVGALTITAQKTVDGAEPNEEQVYEFVLAGDGVELKARNDKGSIVFDELTYDEKDVGKTYTYTIKEITESTDLLIADDSVYELKVTVSDNGDGTLKVQPVISKDGKQEKDILFNNQQLAHLTISKKVEGVETDEVFGMIVRLYDADGAELTAAYEYTGDVTGKITSGGTIALADGQSVTIKGLPDGTKYTVEEDGSKAYTTTVNGKAGTKAEGLATGSSSSVDFINTLETTTFSVTKVWEGTDLGAVVLRIYADGELMEPQPEVNRADNLYTVTGLPRYNEDGEEIVYTAKEKGIEGYIRIYKNVAPYEDVTSCLHDGGTVINRREKQVSFKIQKVWAGLDEGEAAPDITLTLYCNGEVMEMATPTPDSDGWYKYYDLPVAINGQAAIYTVVEEPVAGFTTTYEDANGAAAETGVNGGKIINTKVPQTGDDASLGLWLAMMGASAAMLTMLLRRRKAY